MVLSNYSFLSSVLNENLNSPSRWYIPNGAAYPIEGNKYFDKLEFLFQKYASSKKTQKMLEDRIDFYNGLIEGRNDKMKCGFFSTVPLLFDLKYTTTSSIAYENEVDIRDLFFRKDLLYMRLKKAKQDKADFNKNRNANKTFSKLFLRQSKYIPIISASSFIMKGIIK